jgi:hypothetical protein
MEPVYAEIELQNLHCNLQNDQNNPNNPAEPYLWAVFFKVDGKTATVTGSTGNLMLSGTTVEKVVSGFQNHGDLKTRGVKAGDDVPIPAEVGQHAFVVTPIAIDSQGFVGCAVFLMEQDDSLDSVTNQAHQAFNNKFEEVLNQRIPFLYADHPGLSEPEIRLIKAQLPDTVTAALRRDWAGLNFWGSKDYDDIIGSAVFTYSQKELTNNGGISVSESIKSRREDWQLTANVRGRSAKEMVNEAFLEGLGRYPSEDDPIDRFNASFWIRSLVSYSHDYFGLSTLPSGIAKVLANFVCGNPPSRFGDLERYHTERRTMITRSYWEALGRAPDDHEIEDWFNSLFQNHRTYRDLVGQHVNWLLEPENAEKLADMLTRASLDALGLAPDSGQVNDWYQSPMTYRALVGRHIDWLLEPENAGKLVEFVTRAYAKYGRVPNQTQLNEGIVEIQEGRLTFVEFESQLA